VPDVEIKPQRYRDERPAEFFERYHPRVRSGEPEMKVDEVVRVAHPTREQQQEAADIILERIRSLHGDLARLGHRGALRAARRCAAA
jgi:hypothetical protein